MKATVHIINKRELYQKFETLRQIPKRKTLINKAAKEAATPLFQVIKAEAPRKSGSLKKAIKLRVSKRSRKRIGVNIAVTRINLLKYIEAYHTRASKKKNKRKGYSSKYGRSKDDKHWFYPAILEYGSERMKKHDYMKRNAKAYGPAIQQDFAHRIVKIINDHVGKPTQLTLFDRFK